MISAQKSKSIAFKEPIKTNPTSNLQSNYISSLHWSPDGSHILSNSNDSIVRTLSTDLTSFELPFGQTVYDLCWYPGMNVANPATCCYVTASCDGPVQMWNLNSTKKRCSYVTKDHVDNVVSPLSIEFSSDASLLLCGLENHIQVFDIMNPGEPSILRTTPSRKSSEGLKGLVSTMHACPTNPSLFSAGTYSGSIGIFDLRFMERALDMYTGANSNGVTQVRYPNVGQVESAQPADSGILLSTSRRCNQIQAWDLRNTSQPWRVFDRPGMTQQRIQFDVNSTGRYVSTGTLDGQALIYDIYTGECVTTYHHTVHTSIAACQFNPGSPQLILGSGERHFGWIDDDEPFEFDCSIVLLDIIDNTPKDTSS